MSVPKYQRHDEKYENPAYQQPPFSSVCNICGVNPPTRRWEQCCMGARSSEKACEDSPMGCSPESNRMKTCGDCRAKRRALRALPDTPKTPEGQE